MSRPARNDCGTRAAYVRGCHCAACRQANADYYRAHRFSAGLTSGRGLPSITEFPDPSGWISQAACAGMDTELWFCDDSGESYRYARAVCRNCPVRNDCLEWALDTRTGQGMWGGKSPRERERLRHHQLALVANADHQRVDEVRPKGRFL